jgi:hypothetical protein
MVTGKVLQTSERRLPLKSADERLRHLPSYLRLVMKVDAEFAILSCGKAGAIDHAETLHIGKSWTRKQLKSLG